MKFLLSCALILWSLIAVSPAQAEEASNCHSLLNFSANKLRSDEVIDFCERFENKTLLVVNTASRCGFTPQFKELEELYQKYKDQGLAIVGFPSNDFRQEYSDAKQTAKVCYVNYGVTFDMLSESSVRGKEVNPFFAELLKRTAKTPSWNFNKYLISADGSKILHFPSNIAPLDSRLESAVIEML